MKRKIISIDHDLCNGCGNCIPGCPEGALQMIDGKARLLSDLFCDGLGACIGTCPQGAITIEEREAEAYNERQVMANIVKQGPNTIKAHLIHLQEHGETIFLHQAIDFLNEHGVAVPAGIPAEAPPPGDLHAFHGCPGSRAIDRRPAAGQSQTKSAVSATRAEMPSALQTWPVQLQLLNPQAAYFDNADLLVAADCAPFAYANFHARLLQGKIPLIFCPKLDQTLEMYVSKLAAIFQSHNIRSLTIARMEVPCCSGINAVVQKALSLAGKEDLPVHEQIISISGQLLTGEGQ